MANIEVLLRQALTENNLICNAHEIKQLLHYLQLLQHWNRVYNLTAITDARKMVYLHIIDSLQVAPFLYGTNYLDVGSGAGLPGIPLAIIAKSNCTFTLLDKNSKKTRFLTYAIAELQLTSRINIAQSRCEDFNPDGCFDTILARAFTSMVTFANLTTRLLCPHGRLIAMKGRYPAQELDELAADAQRPTRMRGSQYEYFVKTTKIEVQGEMMERHIVEIQPRLG